jgi:DMSO/TMAO reductase YedYZ molybdopterin-dependent catalytic subunit
MNRLNIWMRIFIVVSMASLVTSCGAPASTPVPGEVEATEFQGKKLVAIKDQRNNALAGTQTIDKDTYKLTVDGLVEKPLSLSYSDLQALPQISKLADLPCVEGWSFTAKWTGPTLASILDAAGAKPEAKILIFHTADDANPGYSSLEIGYIRQNNIIIALKDNDITLPAERGFPFQVVAESKFGYKWSKWITRIEVSDNENFRGYWESGGYNNNADAKGPAYQSGDR